MNQSSKIPEDDWILRFAEDDKSMFNVCRLRRISQTKNNKNKKIHYTGMTLTAGALSRLSPPFESGSVMEMQTGNDSAGKENAASVFTAEYKYGYERR